MTFKQFIVAKWNLDWYGFVHFFLPLVGVLGLLSVLFMLFQWGAALRQALRRRKTTRTDRWKTIRGKLPPTR